MILICWKKLRIKRREGLCPSQTHPEPYANRTPMLRQLAHGVCNTSRTELRSCGGVAGSLAPHTPGGTNGIACCCPGSFDAAIR
jgi:hypothetical protein